MLPGMRAVLDVEPIVVSSNPKQLEALSTALAALPQEPVPHSTATVAARPPRGEMALRQLLPEVTAFILHASLLLARSLVRDGQME